MKVLKTILCYVSAIWLWTMAYAKLCDCGPIVLLNAYPIPEWLKSMMLFIEFIGGLLLFIGAENRTSRLIAGLMLAPLLFGAIVFHFVFGWLEWFGGIAERWYFVVPSFLTYLGIILATYQDALSFFSWDTAVVEMSNNSNTKTSNLKIVYRTDNNSNLLKSSN